MPLSYGSVCSGIEAATVAWHPLGWRPQFFSEIDAAARSVLSHHYPEVPLHGDFTTIQKDQYEPIDLLVGGTPCQSFSLAGLRGGLGDDRGNLALEYLRLAQRLRPKWLVWENVPGVLSSNGGRDFGAILGGMVELGYGFAYRVLDAQYVRVGGFWRAVPQRRRRVFVVGCLGDWRRAAAVLFERESLCGNPAPRRLPQTSIAASLTGSLGRRGGQPDGGDTEGHLIAHATAATLDASYARLQGASGQDLRHGHSHLVAFGGNDTRGPIEVATPVLANGGPCGWMDFESETFIAFDTTQITSAANRSNPQPGDPCHPLVAAGHPPAIAFNCRQDPDVTWDRSGTLGSSAPQAEAIAFQTRGSNIDLNGEIAATLGTNADRASGGAPCIAFSCKDHGADATDDGVTPTLRAMGHSESHPNAGGQLAVTVPGRGILWAVRRLTPLECERLQGFPDGYTAVPGRRGAIQADGPRYKQLGNSMAVNAMRWIGERIEFVESMS